MTNKEKDIDEEIRKHLPSSYQKLLEICQEAGVTLKKTGKQKHKDNQEDTN